jgi:Domain of unknown function (DUF4332)
MASIAAIPGLLHGEATKLRKARVRTTEALLKMAASRKGRRELAAGTGLDERRILDWVNRADLMRVKGIGSEYVDLLEAVGVDKIRELRRRNPANLLESMSDFNLRKRLVRRLPTESMVAGWVESAKTTDPMVVP